MNNACEIGVFGLRHILLSRKIFIVEKGSYITGVSGKKGLITYSCCRVLFWFLFMAERSLLFISKRDCEDCSTTELVEWPCNEVEVAFICD